MRTVRPSAKVHPARTGVWLGPLAALALASLAACGRTPPVTADGDAVEPQPQPGGAAPQATENPLCPARGRAQELLPGVRPEYRTLAYWTEGAGAASDLDEPLLSAEAIRSHDEALALDSNPAGDGVYDLRTPGSETDLTVEINDRFVWLTQKFDSGEYVDAAGEPASPPWRESLREISSAGPLESQIRVALGEVAIHCMPWPETVLTPSLDGRFDRNRCSTARAQEPLEILRAWPGGMYLGRTEYALGWIASDAPLSPPLPRDVALQWLAAPARRLGAQAVLHGDDGAFATIAEGSFLRVDGAGAAWFADDAGLHRAMLPVDGSITAEPPAFTRRAFLETTFSMLGDPYGWGDAGGGRDCSRFVMDALGAFGLRMPRHSANQAIAGTWSIDVSGADERRKLDLIRAAHARGVVLLHFPGHIMLLLGLGEDSEPIVMHAFAEYLVPCPEEEGGGETLLEVDGINVSTLELGRGTSRTAFIERLTRITVVGRAPGWELQGVAAPRPTAPMPAPPEGDACDDSQSNAIFVSPRQPVAEEPMRAIAVSSRDPGPSELLLFAPNGELREATVSRYGGPPWGRVAQVSAPGETGTWTAVLADGSRSIACLRFEVRQRRAAPQPSSSLVWEPARSWTEATENLFALWVEALFTWPVDEDLSWPNLHSLTRDATHNILVDHLGLDEDEQLTMEPDCADLPYSLRAYFAWKLSLPFGYRQCSRGRSGRPPSCGEVQSHLVPRERPDDVGAFQFFLNRYVRNGVHSASGRTLPDDEATDIYPVAVTRDALLPGTVYADPYGHLLIIANWIPQGLDSYGILVGFDAQPDGTVGRRRFWRGNFLFTPDTADVGAGFKAWRPLVYSRDAGILEALPNDGIDGRQGRRGFSLQQYAGSADDFYDAMESVINPRPLDAEETLVSLIDALQEAAVRRATSVENGEVYMRENGEPVVDMPRGYSIFETTGPWEDFSTPSRDMRLLIAIDTVVSFPDAVRRRPERFGVRPEQVEDAVEAVRERMQGLLSERTMEYRRSDTSPVPITLADLVERAPRMEMAYNPNDCAEWRWGAAPGSDEASTCTRRAPPDQQALMEEYRPWFHDRRRPPR